MPRKIVALPSQKTLKELFTYDAKHGVLRWKQSRGTAQAGAAAGWTHQNGYIYIGLNGRSYKAHRLIWMYVHGADPKGIIDHIDRNKANNRIANLRVVTDGQSNQNKGAYKNNVTGHKGVGWYPLRKLWRVRIQHNGRVHTIGYFSSVAAAVAARNAAEKKLHTHRQTF